MRNYFKSVLIVIAFTTLYPWPDLMAQTVGVKITQLPALPEDSAKSEDVLPLVHDNVTYKYPWGGFSTTVQNILNSTPIFQHGAVVDSFFQLLVDSPTVPGQFLTFTNTSGQIGSAACVCLNTFNNGVRLTGSTLGLGSWLTQPTYINIRTYLFGLVDSVNHNYVVLNDSGLYLSLNSTQHNGYVLTTSNSGLTSWQPATSNAWGIDGNTNVSNNFIGSADLSQVNIAANVQSSSASIINLVPTTASQQGALYLNINDTIHNSNFSTVINAGGNGFATYEQTYAVDSISDNAYSYTLSSANDETGGFRLGFQNYGTAADQTSGFFFGNVYFQQDSATFLYTGSTGHNELTPVMFSETLIRFDTSVQIIDGTQGLGKVFTSDANGLGSWQTPVAHGATGSEPGSPYLGELYMDVTLTKLKFWNGSVWAVLTSTP